MTAAILYEARPGPAAKLVSEHNGGRDDGKMNVSPDFYIELANRLWVAFETWPHGVMSRTARADLRLASEAIRHCAMERLEREEPKAVNCQDGRPGAASPEADQQIADFAGDLEHELVHDAVLQIDPRATRAVILGRRLGKRTLAMSSSHEVLRLVDRIKPILVGQPPARQGAALAECLALWLAGHPLAAREDLLTMHIATVRLLTPLNAAPLRGE